MVKIEIRGLSLENIKKISKLKEENDYFYNYRIKSYEIFNKLSDPNYGPKASIDYNKIIFYKSNQD